MDERLTELTSELYLETNRIADEMIKLMRKDICWLADLAEVERKLATLQPGHSLLIKKKTDGGLHIN